MEQEVPSLLILPDDVICVLLRYLDATSLYNLGRTCTRLDDIIRNHFTLWQRIDARRGPGDWDKVLYCLDRCYDDENSGTHTLQLRSNVSCETFCDLFFKRVNSFTKLTILALENQMIDGSEHTVSAFPSGLHELSLKRTVVKNSSKFFKGSGDHFKKLRVLILDECDWLRCSAFMPISKYKSLEILSVYMCKNVEDSIAYLSLASHGFKALKILDARLSPFGNVLIHTIHRVPLLLAIYLQNNDLSYRIDYYKRRIEIVKGTPTRDFVKTPNEFDIDKSLTNDEDDSNNEEILDDNGLVDYLSMGSEEKTEGLPQSVLYLDPYNKCTCNYDNKSDFSGPDSPSNDDDSKSDMQPLFKTMSSLSKLVGQINRRRPYNNVPRSPPITHTTVIHVHRANGARENNNVIFMNILSDNRDEPPVKRMRMDGAVAINFDDARPGPSGVNANHSQNEEAAQRPPTPHPDIMADLRSAVRIYFRDPPIVHIEHIKEIHKNMKVPLRRLSLRGYKKITNTALDYIKDLDLDLIDLTYTSVTVKGITEFLKSHPLCRVVHEKFCTCPTNLHF